MGSDGLTSSLHLYNRPSMPLVTPRGGWGGEGSVGRSRGTRAIERMNAGGGGGGGGGKRLPVGKGKAGWSGEGAPRKEVGKRPGCHWFASDKGGGRGRVLMGREQRGKGRGGEEVGSSREGLAKRGGAASQLDRGRRLGHSEKGPPHTKKWTAVAEPRRRGMGPPGPPGG